MLLQIKDFISDLRGGDTPLQLYLGILLGFSVGFIPTWNAISIVCIFLLFITKANTPVAVLFAALGSVITKALAAQLNSLGEFLINNGGSNIASAAYNTPLLSFANLHYYNVFASTFVTLILALLIFPFIVKYLMRIIHAVDSKASEILFFAKKPIKFIINLLLGKKSNRRRSIFSKWRIITLVILCLVIFIPIQMQVNKLAKESIVKTLEKATDKKVQIENVSVSLLSGNISIDDLEIYKEKSSNNVLQTAEIEGGISVSNLLRRRFIIDNINIERLEVDQPKKQRNQGDTENKAANKPLDSNILGKLGLGGVNLSDAAGYLETGQKIGKYVQSAYNFLNSDNESLLEITEAKYEEKSKNYFAEKCKSCIPKHNKWVIEKVRVNELFVNEKAPTFYINATDISSSPSLYGKKPDIKFDIDEKSKEKYKGKLDSGANKLLNKFF